MTHQPTGEFATLSEALDELVLRAAAIQLVQAAEQSIRRTDDQACKGEDQADTAPSAGGTR